MALIYIDDAPSLEIKLHRKFDRMWLNTVNKRKEFFRASLQQIKEATDESMGKETEFKITIVAEEYYESLRLQDASTVAA